MAKIGKRGTGYCITIPKMMLDLMNWEIGEGVTLNILNSALVVRNAVPEKKAELPTIEQLEALGV